MRRFEFSLEKVLKLKQRREWLAQQHQKKARAALDVARAEVHALQEQIARNAASFASRIGQGDGGWLARWQQSARFADRMSVLEAMARDAKLVYDEASAARTRIATEVEALLFLRRQQWQEHRLHVERARQEQLDEVGLRQWREARQESGQTS